jgi:hypothetical protein
MNDTRNVKGLAEVDRFLQQLPGKIQRNVMRGGLRAGAGELRDGARENVNSISGALARSYRLTTRARGTEVTAAVVSNHYTAQWVEYGTKPHVIRAKDGGALAFGGNLYESVLHPGAKAQAPMRRALDERASAAVVAAGMYIRNRLATKHGLETAGIVVESE